MNQDNQLTNTQQDLLNNLLFSLAYDGDLAGVKDALTKGADINAKNGLPLLNSILHGYSAVSAFLIKSGTDLSKGGKDIVNAALTQSSDTTIACLLRETARQNLFYEDIFIHTIKNSDFSLVKIFIETGKYSADTVVDVLDESFNSINHLNLAIYLAENGTDISKIINLAVLAATALNDINAIQLLIVKHGGDPDIAIHFFSPGHPPNSCQEWVKRYKASRTLTERLTEHLEAELPTRPQSIQQKI